MRDKEADSRILSDLVNGLIKDLGLEGLFNDREEIEEYCEIATELNKEKEG